MSGWANTEWWSPTAVESWMSCMKCVFTLCLFFVFLYKFGLPSYRRYSAGGVITETSWEKRKNTDWPAITFCPLRQDTLHGWRNNASEVEDIYKTWTDRFCSEAESMEDALECLHRGTFSLNETILNTNESWKYLGTDNQFWRWDLTDITRHGNFTIWYSKQSEWERICVFTKLSPSQV